MVGVLLGIWFPNCLCFFVPVSSQGSFNPFTQKVSTYNAHFFNQINLILVEGDVETQSLNCEAISMIQRGGLRIRWQPGRRGVGLLLKKTKNIRDQYLDIDTKIGFSIFLTRGEGNQHDLHNKPKICNIPIVAS